MNSTRRVVVSIISMLACACGSAVEAPQEGQGPTARATNGPAPTVKPSTAAPAQPGSLNVTRADTGLPQSVLRLFARMDSIGQGSDDAYKSELLQFASTPDAVSTLATVYTKLPRTAYGARWKVVEAAGQIQSNESVSFLQGVALSQPEIDAADTGEEAGDKGFRMRYTAAVGVVRQLVSGVDGAANAVDTLLKSADPQIAQMVGVELFSAGRLTDAHRKMLAARRIPAAFRLIEGAELDALRAVDPERTVHQGADTRTRAKYTTVPALGAGE